MPTDNDRIRSSCSIPPSPRAVLFDWDGTLAYSRFPHLFTAADMPHTRPTLSSHVVSVVRSLPGGASTEIAMRQALGVYLPPESRSTLRMLREHSIPTGIVSNVLQNTLAYEVPHYLRDLSEGIVYRGVNETIRRKPGTEGILNVLEALKLPPSEHIWMVGDRYSTDMLAAIQSRLSAVLIHPTPDERLKLSRHEAGAIEPIYVVEGHHSLMELLSRSLSPHAIARS